MRGGWRRHLAYVALLVVLALVAACSTTPAAPRAITLAGVVVDGQRVARPDEAGLVGIVRNGQRQDGRAGSVLQPGDVVVTGPNAFALIRYPSGSEVFMRPNTQGQVGSFIGMVGEVFAKIRGAFAIQTTFVSAGAEGTAYSVRAAADGSYAVIVFDGTVRLASLANAWPSVALPRGTMSAGRPQEPPRAMATPADELARTRAWVERMEALLPAPRGSSSIGPALAIAALVAVIAASASHGDDALPAPTGLAIDNPFARRLGYRSCRGLALSWQGVAGARDYVVALDGTPSDRPNAWQRVDTLTAGAPPASFGDRLRPNWNYRASVQARDGRGHAGHASPPLQFGCNSDSVVR